MSEQFTNKESAIAYLAAMGHKESEIADTLSMSSQTVKTYLNSERIQFEIKRLRYKHFGVDATKRFKEILPKAIQAVEDVLDNPATKPATKLAASTEVMDRALGKPKQTIEHEGSLIRTLFERLDNKTKVASIPIEAEIVSETLMLPQSKNPNTVNPIETEKNPNLAPEDPIDSWAKNL